MGNLEKSVTWGLIIVFLGCLFMVNCECGEETTCPLNNGFNISNTDLNVDPLKKTNFWREVFTNINGDVLKIDAPETVEEVEAEETINDTTVVAETNIDSTGVEVEE